MDPLCSSINHRSHLPKPGNNVRHVVPCAQERVGLGTDHVCAVLHTAMILQAEQFTCSPSLAKFADKIDGETLHKEQA